MALGRKTEICCDLAAGIFRVGQQILRKTDLLPADIFCQSDVLAFMEEFRQIAGVQPDGVRDPAHADPAVQMRENIVFTFVDMGIPV